jgi:hypothetical protein
MVKIQKLRFSREQARRLQLTLGITFIFVDAQLVGVMGKAHNFLCLIISIKPSVFPNSLDLKLTCKLAICWLLTTQFL